MVPEDQTIHLSFVFKIYMYYSVAEELFRVIYNNNILIISDLKEKVFKALLACHCQQQAGVDILAISGQK